MLVQYSSVNIALLYANNAGPWNFASEECSSLCWPCDPSSMKLAFASLAISMYNALTMLFKSGFHYKAALI